MIRVVTSLQCALTLASAPALAQSNIALDGSLPHGRTDVVTSPGSGPDYEIGEELGWRAGSNLFHSFLDFDLATGDSATFTADAALPPLDNVLTRVTGGNPSRIDGTLRSAIPGADFFFLNPAGVLFGGQASIDVPAAFSVSTAHELHFQGVAERLDLLDARDPLLRAEPPEAFGFLEGGPRAPIVFSVASDFPFVHEYAVAPGETLSAVGGDVRVQGDLGVPGSVTLRATGGRLQLAAVGDAAAAVPLDLAGYSDPNLNGEVRVNGSSALLAVANRSLPQGTVLIRGGRFVLEEGSVVRGGGVAGPGGASIDLELSESVAIRGASTLLRAESPGSFDSGGIRIRADRVEVGDAAVVETQTVLDAVGGEVRIEARSVEVSNGAVVASVNRRNGVAGAVRIDASETLDVQGGAEIRSLASSDGAAGDIELRTGALRVIDARVGSQSGVRGPAGSIAIDAGNVELSGAARGISTVNRSALASSGGGDIRIDSSGALRVRDGALISATTEGVDSSGAITLDVGSLEIAGGGLRDSGEAVSSSVQTVTLGAGDAGNLSVAADSIRIGASPTSPAAAAGRAGILQSFVAGADPSSGRPAASGNGGSLYVEANRIALEDGAQISSLTEGAGPSGSVSVLASGSIELRGDAFFDGETLPSGIFSRSESDASAGSLTLQAPTVLVLDGAELSSRALGSGDSGDILVEARDQLTVSGRGRQVSVVTARGIDGSGGDIALRGEHVEVRDGAVVDVSTAGAGAGGVLRVEAGSLLVAGRDETGLAARLGAQADSTGNAGGIDIAATGLVEIGEGGELTALSEGVGGNPGDIEVRAAEILVRGALTSESANGAGGSVSLVAEGRTALLGGGISVLSADTGDAGDVSIQARRFVAREGSITADAEGFGGNVEIQASRLVQLVDSQVLVESRGGANAEDLAGGNIRIFDAPVALSNSTLTANGFGNADGGNVFITANPLLVSGDSQITASSEFGFAGQIVLDSPNAEITGELAALADDFLDASSLLVESCLARDGVAGSFAVRRLGGPASAPDTLWRPEAGEPTACEAP